MAPAGLLDRLVLRRPHPTLPFFLQLSSERLRPLDEYLMDGEALISESGGSSIDMAVAWLVQANDLTLVIDDAKYAIHRRYVLRNLAVTLTLGLLLVGLLSYVLHTLTFADPAFILTFRQHVRQVEMPHCHSPTRAARRSITM